MLTLHRPRLDAESAHIDSHIRSDWFSLYGAQPTDSQVSYIRDFLASHPVDTRSAVQFCVSEAKATVARKQAEAEAAAAEAARQEAMAAQQEKMAAELSAVPDHLAGLRETPAPPASETPIDLPVDTETPTIGEDA